MLTLSQFAVNVITLLGIIVGTALCTTALVVSAMQAAAEVERRPIALVNRPRAIPRITTSATSDCSVYDIDFDPLFGGFGVRQLTGGAVVASTPPFFTLDEAVEAATRLNDMAIAA